MIQSIYDWTIWLNTIFEYYNINTDNLYQSVKSLKLNILMKQKRLLHVICVQKKEKQGMNKTNYRVVYV